ncbi:hypothetical protein A2U01_0028315 [Trifolium medium]|uniref:Uncharacterized protein n=1 Tax=Trifolium medium TaxID=97028 RepID=A0A392P779_9FABA|nr:hypothetical protein [Trifolium medium]
MASPGERWSPEEMDGHGRREEREKMNCYGEATLREKKLNEDEKIL